MGEAFEDVAATAMWVAAYRAEESERPDALFHDPLAGKLAGERGRRLAREVVGAKNFAWLLALRTWLIDDYVRLAVEGGANVVVNLGAGMDTRPYRLDVPRSLRWIEIDQEKIVMLKNERLAGEQPRCALERVAADLANDEERRRVLGAIDGDVVVITEGVLGYLETHAVAALARDLRARPGFRRWIMDYASPVLRKAMQRRRRVQAQFRNAPLRFRPPDWERFFADAGWRVESMRYHVIEGERLGRRMPLPLWMRAARPFLPARRREELRKLSAIALLSAAEDGAVRG